MQNLIQETQTSLFVNAVKGNTRTTTDAPFASSAQRQGHAMMKMEGSKQPMHMKSSLGSSSKMMMSSEKKYSVFNSGSPITGPQSHGNSNSRVARSNVVMSATSKNDTSIIKKTAGNFAPSKYIDQSIEQSKSQNIAVEVTIPEEPTFEVDGATPDLAAGHLDQVFGHSKKAIVSPSLLACDQGAMAKELVKAVDAGAEMIHFDIMDGNFVSNLTWGPPMVKALRKVSDVHFDCHVQIKGAINWVDIMADAGADTFTFHLEEMYDHDAEGNEIYDEARCNEKVFEMIQKIKTNETRKMRVGMTLRVDTPVERLKAFLDAGDVDCVMIMCIPLGFGGQPFNSDMMQKVAWLRQNYPDLDIEVDGGVGPKTVDECAKAGANILVAGSAVYGAEDLRMPIAELIRSVEKHGNKMSEDDMTPMPVPLNHDKQQSTGDD